MGLLEPLIWNRRTGNLVGGHQRLASLDALEGSSDYLLDVACVDLTEKQEKEQNIALNNANMQGEWDMDVLGGILKTEDFDLDASGFDFADVQVMFDDPDIATMFAPNDETQEILTEVEQLQEEAKKQRQAEKTKAARAAFKERTNQGDDTEVFAVVLFQHREGREKLMAHLLQDPEDRYVDGKKLLELLNTIRKSAASE